MDEITAFLIACCAAIPVISLALVLARAVRSGARIRTVVVGLTLLHETVLVALPGWYSCFTGFQLEAGIGVTAQQLLPVYAGEALFVLLFAVALLFSTPAKQSKAPAAGERGGRARGSGPAAREHDSVVVYGLLFGAALLYIGRLFSPVFTAQDVAQHYQLSIKTNIWDAILDWAMTLVQWPGLFAAALVSADRRAPRWARALGASVLAAELIFAMLHGFRGGVVWVVSMVAAAGYYAGQKRLLLAAAVLTLFLIPLFPWLHSTMRYASIDAPLGTSRIEMIPFLVRGITNPETIASGADASGFFESWAVRAEGPRNSIALYALHDSGDAASYKPILGAIVLPAPRLWWPDKPVAGSTDATNLGSAIYRVQQSKPNSAFYDMGPILASAHAYWEGGWVWLIGAPLASGLMWRWLVGWAEKAQRRSVDVIILTFTAALPIDGFFGAINPVFAYVRLLWITLLPLGLAMLVAGKYRRTRRTSYA